MLKKITIVFFITIVILAAVEGLSRIALGRIYNRNFDSALIIDNKYFSSSGLAPNKQSTIWGKYFSTDSLGGRKNKTAPSSAKKKWLLIGDSVTEGVGVDDSATFSSLFSTEMPDYSVLNYSLIGYSTADYVNVLRYMLQSDTATELVTLFYCLNDVYERTSTQELPLMAQQNFIGKLNALLQDRYATYRLLKLLVYQHSDRYFKYDLQFYTPRDTRFTNAMNDLLTCDSLCKVNHTYFNVVVLPYRSQLASKNYLPQQLIKTFCEQHHIEFSDAAAYLQQQPSCSALYLFADEIHFSDKGHKAIAEFLSQ